MKNHPFYLLFLIIVCTINLQAQNYNKELLKSYSQKELNNLNFSEFSMLEYALENACYLTPIPEGKTVDFPEIELKTRAIKFTDLGLKIIDKTQYFIAKNQNKLLVVKSDYILNLEIKNKKK
jgi:hypothetical protein